MSESKKNSFVLYHDIREPLELLSDAERGRLLTAILNDSEYDEWTGQQRLEGWGVL